MGESTGAYRILIGESEGKKSLGRFMRRCEEDNIKMVIQRLG
jgi:hypothetical protein